MKKSEKAGGNEEKNMSVSGHLRELRNRIIVCLICLVVFLLIGLAVAPNLVSLLTSIGKEYGYHFIYVSPQELLLQYFSVSLLFGVCLTLPMILYEIWAFVRPGLRKNENGLFLTAMFFGLICFAIGVLFALKILLPFTLHFLIDLSSGTDIQASISVQNYVSFLLTIFVIFGIVFELPVVSVVLAKMGLLKPQWMRKARRIIIVAIFFIAAVITPPDVVSQIMVAIPMVGLYELSILLCSLVCRKDQTDGTDDEKGAENPQAEKK